MSEVEQIQQRYNELTILIKHYDNLSKQFVREQLVLEHQYQQKVAEAEEQARAQAAAELEKEVKEDLEQE